MSSFCFFYGNGIRLSFVKQGHMPNARRSFCHTKNACVMWSFPDDGGKDGLYSAFKGYCRANHTISETILSESIHPASGHGPQRERRCIECFGIG